MDFSQLFKEQGRFQLLRKLGEGGMATVWLALDIQLDVERAIKVMKPAIAKTVSLRDRFLREARVMAKLQHPNAVQIFDVGELGGCPYLVMELVHGGTVKDYLQSFGAMHPRMAVDVMITVLEVLDRLHHLGEEGIVHRDVKPENILLTLEGQPKLADFGIAHNEGSTATKTNVKMGTVFYMSPEQHTDAKNVDVRSDLYLVAATLWVMLTNPVERDLPPLFAAHLQWHPEILNGINPALCEIIKKGSAPRREDRYQNANEMKEALVIVLEKIPEIPEGTPALGTIKQEQTSDSAKLFQEVPDGGTIVAPEEMKGAFESANGLQSAISGGDSSQKRNTAVLMSGVGEGGESSDHHEVLVSGTLFGENPEKDFQQAKTRIQRRRVILGVSVLGVLLVSGYFWMKKDSVEVLSEQLPVEVVAEVILPEPLEPVAEKPVVLPEEVLQPESDPILSSPVKPIEKRHIPAVKEEHSLIAIPDTVSVSLVGDASAVWLVSKGVSHQIPSDVLPGAYLVEAAFPEVERAEVLSLTIEEGKNIVLSCNSAFAKCKVQ